MGTEINIKNSIKSALESMMYIWGEPLDLKVASDVLSMDKKEVYEHFQVLKEEYKRQERGLQIVEINKSFQFVTAEENYTYLERLCTPKKAQKLSTSALEVLAIIAYKQPITKGEIDVIRGLKCERVIDGLIKKELIEEKGRSSAIGRPILYGTTNLFLKYFGLEKIKDLPDIENIENLIDETLVEEENNTTQMSLDL